MSTDEAQDRAFTRAARTWHRLYVAQGMSAAQAWDLSNEQGAIAARRLARRLGVPSNY